MAIHKSILNFALRGGAILALTALAGCIDPVAREDSIDPSFGNAVAANKAVHIANPWPRESFDTRLASDGGPAVAGLKQYRTGAPLGGHAAGVVSTQ